MCGEDLGKAAESIILLDGRWRHRTLRYGVAKGISERFGGVGCAVQGGWGQHGNLG